MATQGGRVQLERSYMILALNMAKLAKEGFGHTAIEATKYLIKNSAAEVQEVTKRGVEYPGHKKLKAAIHRHQAMLCQNHMSGCLPCHTGPPKNLQTHWQCKGTGAPPPNWCRQLTPDLTPPLPGMPSASTVNNSRSEHSQIANLPAGYTYSHTSLPCGEFFNLDASAQDSQHDTDFDPDMLTQEGTSTGLYTICCVVMPQTSILKTGAAYWVNLQVMTSIDRKAWDFGDYYYIFICIIKKQCTDPEESKWKR